RRSRSAFTLIELLVVIAIIGVLMSLLLPAVQKVREAGNRIKCQNNLKQMITALHAYHDTNRKFPPGRMIDTTGGTTSLSLSFSVHSRLLPYLEQQPLFDTIDFKSAWDSAANAAPRGTMVSTFVCPSDPYNQVPTGIAPTN